MTKSTYVFLPGLKAARTRAALSRPELARAIGVSPNTIAGWEQLRKRPSTGRLEDIADALDTSVAVLKEPAVASDIHPSKSLHVHALKGLKAARMEAGLLQKELAPKVHIGTAAVAKWENGGRLATDVQLHALADVLGVAPESLLIERRVKSKDALPKITYADIQTDHAPRSDMEVRRENHQAYWESKKKPRRCECCGYPIAAYNKNSVYCYTHVSPDARREYRERFGVAS